MIVINPTKSDIKVQIEGVEYFLPAEGSITGVREEHALYWKQKLHSFVQIKMDEPVVKKEVKVEEVAPVAEAPIEKKVTKK